MGPFPGVAACVQDDGRMQLHEPASDTHLVCDEAGTAMWIALNRADWNIGDAAAALAEAWDADPWCIRYTMLAWIAELAAAGIVAI